MPKMKRTAEKVLQRRRLLWRPQAGWRSGSWRTHEPTRGTGSDAAANGERSEATVHWVGLYRWSTPRGSPLLWLRPAGKARPRSGPCPARRKRQAASSGSSPAKQAGRMSRAGAGSFPRLLLATNAHHGCSSSPTRPKSHRHDRRKTCLPTGSSAASLRRVAGGHRSFDQISECRALNASDRSGMAHSTDALRRGSESCLSTPRGGPDVT